MDIIKKINKSQNSIWIILPTLSIEQLEEVIKLSADSYYNTGTPLVTDEAYDILMDKLRMLNPKSTVFKKVGTTIKGKKVKLPYWMGSMNKIKTDEKALDNWLKINRGPYLVSHKLDGVSCLLTMVDQEVKLYTRGDGVFGQDVTHLLDLVNMTVPDTKEDVAMRGELIMSKKKFEKYSTEMSNARNMVSGIVNSKKDSVNKKHARDVDFIVYEVIVPEGVVPSGQMKLMEEWGLAVVTHKTYKKIDIGKLSDVLKDEKLVSNYEIDGIIVTNDTVYARNVTGNPTYAFAYKGMTETANTKVIDVLWKPAKDGHIIPRIHFVKVRLSQADIEYTMGFNARFINDNMIGPGAIITIVRSGDTIPYVMGVVKPAKVAALPSDMDYEWDSNEVNIMLVDAGENSIVIARRITKFVRDIGVENMSEGIVTRLVEAGYDTIPKVIQLTKKDLMKLDGFQDTLAEKLVHNMDVRLKELDVLMLMVASNCFGRGFGERKIKKILNVYPDIVQKYSASTTQKWINAIVELDGFDVKSATKFIESLAEFQLFYKTIQKIRPVKPYKNIVVNVADGKFKGQTVVFTGFREDQWMKYIEAEGGKVSSSVSKNTTMLVFADGKESSASYVAAKKAGIEMISKSDFGKKFMKK